MLELGPFQANATRDKITVTRADGVVIFNAAELATASKLLSMAMEYCNSKALPPFLQWDKFVIRFSEDGNHMFSRIGEEDGVIVTQNDGDDLINLLSSCLSTHVDAVRLTGGPRRGAKPSVPDPVVIGRE